MFENLCLRDLKCYADAIDGVVYHYRDSNGLEADAVVETKDGNWCAFEIKLGKDRIEEGVTSLLKLKKKIEDEGGRQPVSLCVITGGGLAHMREDGVCVIPVNSLAP